MFKHYINKNVMIITYALVIIKTRSTKLRRDIFFFPRKQETDSGHSW